MPGTTFKTNIDHRFNVSFVEDILWTVEREYVVELEELVAAQNDTPLAGIHLEISCR